MTDQADLSQSVLRVQDRGGSVLGTAFVVELDNGDGTSRSAAITCAHVVSAAQQPRGSALTLTLCAVVEGAPVFQAAVDWDRVLDEADVALLPLPPDHGLTPLLFASDDRCEGHDFTTYGFPSSAPDDAKARLGRWGGGRAVGAVGHGLQRGIQFGESDTVTGGFSGAPAFDLHARRVVAMLTDIARVDQHQRGRSTAFGVPASVVRQVVPALARRRDRPYRGLDPFTEADARFWVDPSAVYPEEDGPSGLKARILARLDGGERLVAVVGPSGVGKSSLLHAGLLPELRTRAQRWNAEVAHVRLNRELVLQAAAACAPHGADRAAAVGALVATLRGQAMAAADPAQAQGAGDRRGLVLILDQFEEILLVDPASCRAVARPLLALLPVDGAALEGVGPVRLLLALREHFLGLFGERVPELKRRVLDASVSVPLAVPLGTLQRIIEEPARVAGRAWNDPLLVVQIQQALARAYAAESDQSVRCTALPVLQVFLARQWDAREADAGVAPDVQSEIDRAIGKLVDSVVEGVAAKLQGGAPPAGPPGAARKGIEALTTRLLVKFVAFGTGFEARTPKSRSRRQGEIESRLAPHAQPGTVAELIRALIDGRVLSARAAPPEDAAPPAAGGPLLELVHDAVLTGWAPLRGPIEQERELWSWQASLREQAVALRKLRALTRAGGFQLRRAATRLLLEGRELDEASQWMKRRGDEIDPDVRALVRESQAQERWRRALWRSGLAGVSAVIVGLAVFAGYQEYRDQKQQQEQLEADNKAQLDLLRRQRLGYVEQNRIGMGVLGGESGALLSAIRAAERFETEKDPEIRRQVQGALLRGLLAYQLRAPFDIAGTVPSSVALTGDGTGAVFRTFDEATRNEHYWLWDTRTAQRPIPATPSISNDTESLAKRRICAQVYEKNTAKLREDCGEDPSSVLFQEVVGSHRERALLMPDTQELWLSKLPDPGVQRISLQQGRSISPDVVAGSWTVVDLDRSSDGSTVAMATMNQSVVLWDVERGQARELPHPGPVLQVATANGGRGSVTLGWPKSCYYPDGSSVCKELEVSGLFGSVEITGDGSIAAVSAFPPDLVSGLVASEEITGDGSNAAVSAFPPDLKKGSPTFELMSNGRPLYHAASTVLDLELEQADSEGEMPMVKLRGYDARRNIPLELTLPLPARRESLGQLENSDGRPADQELRNVKLMDDGAWSYELGSPRACSEGLFRQVASCAGITVLRYADRWFRLGFPKPPPPVEQGGEVLAFDAGRRLALVKTRKDLVELMPVSLDGLGSTPLGSIPCDGGKVHGYMPEGLPQALVMTCGGMRGVVLVRPEAAKPLSWRPTLVRPEDPRLPAKSLPAQVEVDGGRAALRWDEGQVAVVEIESGAILWDIGNDRAADIMGYEADELAIKDMSKLGHVRIYHGGLRGSDIEILTGDDFSVLPTSAGRLFRLGSDQAIVDETGRRVPVIEEGKSPTDADGIVTIVKSGVPKPHPSHRMSASPDGRWVVLKPLESLPIMTRVEGTPTRLIVDRTLTVPGSQVPEPDDVNLTWLPASKGGELRLLAWWPGAMTLWTRGPSGWELEYSDKLRENYSGSGPWLSPSGELAAFERNISEPGQDVHAIPERLVELRETGRWTVIGVIALPGRRLSPFGVRFLDEDHLLLSDPPRVYSIDPQDLRREACDLLQGRSEFEKIRCICDPSSTPPCP